jgi:hypothetical protein
MINWFRDNCRWCRRGRSSRARQLELEKKVADANCKLSHTLTALNELCDNFSNPEYSPQVMYISGEPHMVPRTSKS